MQDLLFTVIRQSITASGGYLVTNGLATSDQVNQIAGAVALLVGLAWSIGAKKLAQRKAAK